MRGLKAPAHSRLSETLGLSKEHKEAIECYDKALEIEPKNADAWYSKGEYLYNIRKNKEAIECFNKVLELDSNYGSAKDKLLDIESIIKRQEEELRHKYGNICLFQINNKRRGISTRSS